MTPVPGDFGGNAHRGTREHLKQRFDGPLHSKITWARTGLVKGCNRRKHAIEMNYTLARFPTYEIVLSLVEIVKIENARISNQDDYHINDSKKQNNFQWIITSFNRPSGQTKA